MKRFSPTTAIAIGSAFLTGLFFHALYQRWNPPLPETGNVSNTYFLNFGPSREALTAVIFASAAELFDKKQISPKSFEGKEIELQGEIKDHPQYGLEIILENPSQLKVID